MKKTNTPFDDLYVSETIPPADFVKLFSDALVPHARRLFQGGNVVIMGTQGSGKSMLLSLLTPSIRAAYANAGAPFPVPPDDRQFIGCGINLRRSGIFSFGQRPIHGDPVEDAQQFPAYFGDFFNYWVVLDLLTSLDVLCTSANGSIAEELQLSRDRRLIDDAAVEIATDDAWFGALQSVRNYSDLKILLQARISEYFRFLNFNSKELESSIHTTKSAIGQPISRAAFHLRRSGVIPEFVNVFVQIDQYEELGQIAQLQRDYGITYRRSINRALSTRDPNISYRIGARRYAWKEDLIIHGAQSPLEENREYSVVDLDQINHRSENSGTYVFPSFAADIVRRRLAFNGFSVAERVSPLRKLLGKRLSPADRASMYVRTGGCAHEAIAGVSADLSDQWRTLLLELAVASPFEARLAGAWMRQRRGKRLWESPPEMEDGEYPWQSRVYWRKERREQALMQIAAVCRQRMVWSGEDDVIALSGGNTLVFVSLCRQIWAAWLRTQSPDDLQKTPGRIPTIEPRTQSVGIEECSLQWFRKVCEQPGGDERQRFLSVVGREARTRLVQDAAMSYPGWNGFSVLNDELEVNHDVRLFLNSCVDAGDLEVAAHTTKEKHRRARTKYYPKPILSPHFSIPVNHVKEPMYLSLDDIRRWMKEAEFPTNANFRSSIEHSQMTLSL